MNDLRHDFDEGGGRILRCELGRTSARPRAYRVLSDPFERKTHDSSAKTGLSWAACLSQLPVDIAVDWVACLRLGHCDLRPEPPIASLP
jgi:hypothetical protein